MVAAARPAQTLMLSGFDFIDSAVRPFVSVIHPDDREQVERSVMQAVDAGRPFTLEYRIVRADGDVRWVLERGQALERAGTILRARLPIS